MRLEAVIHDWAMSSRERARLTVAIRKYEQDGWLLEILEIIDDGDHPHIPNSIVSSKFTEAVEWTNSTLDGKGRMSYDTWVFRSQQEAEKFKTMFTLKWAT